MGFFRRVSGHALRNKISHLGRTWGRVATPRWKEPGDLSRHALGKVFQTCPVTTTYWLVSKYLSIPPPPPREGGLQGNGGLGICLDCCHCKLHLNQLNKTYIEAWKVSRYKWKDQTNKYDVTRRKFHLNYWCIKHLWRLHILNIPHPIDVLQFYGNMNPAQKQRKSRVKRTGIKSLADGAHITENSRTYGSGEQPL